MSDKAYEENLKTISGEAGSDLSAKQYHFVTMAADGQYDATGDGAKADGILQNDPSVAGQAATIGIDGVSKLVVGGAVTAGDDVSSNAAGRGVSATTTGDIILGRALTGASSNGQLIALRLSLSYEPVA